MLRTLFWVIPAPPGSRILTDCKPLRRGPTPQAAVVLPQLFPFFMTIFSAFHFSRPKRSSGGPICFSLVLFPVPRSKADAGTCAHTLHTRHHKLLSGQQRTEPPVNTLHSDDTPGTCDERRPWERRWCPQKTLKEECLLTAALDAGANLPLKTTAFLPRRTCRFVLILL